MQLIGDLKKEFDKVFGAGGQQRVFFAPGRVNLIGEHTDYNGGRVFPCALSVGTYAVARKREDDRVRLYSMNFEDVGVVDFGLDELKYDEKHDWANYPKGVIKAFGDNGYKARHGMEVLFFGNIPNGAGLSSSASIELAASVLLKGLFGFDVDMVSMVKMSQQAENTFVGVNCGIMDQFAIGMGRQEKAVLLDCSTLEYKYCDINLGDALIIIANTNKKRGLADSKYNERRSECERALGQLKQKLNINSLGQLTIEEFEQNKHLITSLVDCKRAKHAVYENRRTLQAVEALERGELEEFGRLMNASHVSLRDDYEVTGVELDTLVQLAWEQDGVVGSRMTGAGFGGCTVSIVKRDKIDQFIKNVGEKYAESIGYQASFYTVSIGDGAREII